MIQDLASYWTRSPPTPGWRSVAMLEDAGLIAVYADDVGREAYRLSEDGVRVGHVLTLAQEGHAEAVLEALLDAGEG